MRKIIALALLLACTGAGAQHIDAEQASKNASDFMRTRRAGNVMNAPDRQTAIPELKLVYTARQDGLEQLYVFNDTEGGFVVAGADERVSGILAYSNDGSFDPATANPNLKYWLDFLQTQIAGAVSQNTPLTPIIELTEKRTDVPILITTRWDQDSPYNSLIVAETSKQMYTGCVATSMSQVMNYYEWPEHGTGSHTYYDMYTSLRSYTRHFDEHYYDWPNMSDRYGPSSTKAQKDAVAELMFDAGVSVNMMYGTDDDEGSAAYTEQVPYALVNFFGYDGGVSHAYRNYFSDKDWDEMIYAELANGRPVMYGGTCKNGGHSFICDGYDVSTGMFHFNWGWGGDGDCYSTLSARYNDKYTFKDQQDIIYGIQKPCGGKSPLNIIIYDYHSLESQKTISNGMVTYTLSFGYDKTYDEYGFIWNDSYMSGDVLFNLKFVSEKNGKTYYAIPENPADNRAHFDGMTVTSRQWEDYPSYYETLTVKNVRYPDMAFGKYRMSLVYKPWEFWDNDSVEWTDVRSFTSERNFVIELVSPLPIPESDVRSLKADRISVGYEGNGLAVRGVADGIEVSAFTPDGALIGTSVSKNGYAFIPAAMEKNNVAVIKAGNESVKYRIEK